MLRGKNAVVTGARGGIGRAIVKYLAKNGANVWACIRKEDNEYECYLKELANRYSVIIEVVCFDMANTGELKEAVKNIIRQRREIDILINNAGIAQYDTFHLMSMETLRNIMNINYMAPLEFTQLLSRRMKFGSSIIFVSSVAGLDAIGGNTAYGSSKAAIAHTTKVLSKELASKGIRVNAVAPGMVDTSMKLKANKDMWESLIAQTDLQRVGTPDEIANVIVFLASNLSSYITGQVIRVDGGMN